VLNALTLPIALLSTEPCDDGVAKEWPEARLVEFSAALETPTRDGYYDQGYIRIYVSGSPPSGIRPSPAAHNLALLISLSLSLSIYLY